MKWTTGLLKLALFVASMALVVIGQRNVGPAGLLIMLAGLAGILILMYLYNRKFQ